MKRTSRISSVLLAVTLVLAVAAPSVLASSGTRIVLRPSQAFPGAKGAAKVKAEDGGRQVEIEVEHVRSLAGKTLSAYVGARKVGTMRVSSLGAAALRRTGSAAPAIAPGTTVRVRTSAGTLVVSGTR